MCNKQKIRYAFFGSVVTFALMAMVAIGVPPLIAQRNGVSRSEDPDEASRFDEIQCTKLTVVNKAGKKAIVLDAMEEANHIILYDQKGHPGLHLWASEEQHSINVLGNGRQTGVSIASGENGNGISIHDNAGKVALNLFVTQTLMGTGIVVYDQTGDVKWVTPASPPSTGEK